jgi:hypothetical protein
VEIIAAVTYNRRLDVPHLFHTLLEYVPQMYRRPMKTSGTTAFELQGK